MTMTSACEVFGRDVVYAIRLMRRNPGYSLAVITVLAVGIAANVIAFSLFKAVALAPLAGVENSGSLLFVGARTTSGQAVPLSYPDYLDIRARAFPDLAAWALEPLILGQNGSARLVQAELISGNYFDVLGVRSQAGRTIAPGDATVRGQQPVVVISDGLWRSAFGADPTLVGRTIRVNHYPLTVVGIADSSFKGGVVGLATDLFVPITMQAALTGRNELDARDDHWVHAFIRPGTIDRDQASARAAQVGRVLETEHPIETLGERAVVMRIWQWPYGAQGYMLPAISLMAAMAALLLVVVSANVAGLVLVRSLARRGEAAARLTLGATRGRLVCQLTIESVVLAVPAAIIGFSLPGWLQSFLGAAQGNVSLPLFFNVEPDRLVVGFTVALAVLSGILYGAVPAVRLSRSDLSTVLKDNLSPIGRRTSRLRSVLVVAQIAGGLVLLVGTVLILRTLEAVQHTNAGFEPRQVSWASFDVRAGGYDEIRGRLFYTRLLDAVRSDPQVTDASLAAFLPLTLVDWMSWNARPDGHQPRPDAPSAFAVNIVTSGYFHTLGIPVVAGREFDDTDATSSGRRLIVNETFARRFWATPAAAIGHRVETGGGHRTIVGVVHDIKYARLDESPRPYMYAPAAQDYSASMTMQVRGRGDATALLARVRAHAVAIDPSLGVLQSGMMADTLRSASAIYETLARVLTLLGVLAAGVAALGVHGLIAYTAKQQAHEIGVRLALGAPRVTIVGSFLRRGVTLAATGAGIGLLASLALTRLMTTLLFGVIATDPMSFAVATLLVMTSALLASLLPAMRAVRADAITALRHQ